jgi:hypothetical protein
MSRITVQSVENDARRSMLIIRFVIARVLRRYELSACGVLQGSVDASPETRETMNPTREPACTEPSTKVVREMAAIPPQYAIIITRVLLDDLR